MIYKDIPYRVWRGKKFDKPSAYRISETRQYKGMMKRVGKLMRKGHAVQLVHTIINPEPTYNKPYDTVTINIEV